MQVSFGLTYLTEKTVEVRSLVFSTGPSYQTISQTLSEIIGTMIFSYGIIIGANKFTDGLNPVIVVY